MPAGCNGGLLSCAEQITPCVFLSCIFCCSKTFGTYEIQQHNRMKHAEAEQLLQAAAALTAAAAPKTDDNNAQQEALVRHKRGEGGSSSLLA